jgi:Spy/CpxP family protein refolding chaperone
MKRIILVLLATVSIQFAQAQSPAPPPSNPQPNQPPAGPPPRPEEHSKHFTEDLARELKLSPEQKTKVYELAITRDKEMHRIHEQYKGQDSAQAMEERKKAMDTFDAGLKQILTAEQIPLWEKFKQEHRRPPCPCPPNTPAQPEAPKEVPSDK